MNEQIENRLGVDIGGTYIKIIVLQGNKILYKNRIETAKTGEMIVESIKEEYCSLNKKYQIASVGVGVPGEIKNGFVTADNLPFWQFPLGKLLYEQLNCPVLIENDANCAALGELYFGSAKECGNMIMITLGTGVGGAVVMNRQIFHGQGTAGEFGHMIIQADQGKNCPCGLSGCWEQYASVTALLRQAESAAIFSKESILFNKYLKNEKKMDGECFFDALKSGCPTAKTVFKKYIGYLAVGIESLANILAPEMVILAGGITQEQDLILEGLKSALRISIRVRISALKNDAGAIGASILPIL